MTTDLIRTVLLVLFPVLLTGCFDYDPFGFAHKNLPGEYSLERTEFDTFYLHKSDTEFFEFQMKTPLGGTVNELGWDDKQMLVSVNNYSKTFRWYVIDLKTDSIRGPILPIDSVKYPELKAIKVYPANKVWECWW